jgi:hypothetical protein
MFGNNYPPGVSNNDPHFDGEEWESIAHCPYDDEVLLGFEWNNNITLRCQVCEYRVEVSKENYPPVFERIDRELEEDAEEGT